MISLSKCQKKLLGKISFHVNLLIGHGHLSFSHYTLNAPLRGNMMIQHARVSAASGETTGKQRMQQAQS